MIINLKIKNPEVLTICCSYRRPEGLKRMLESFYATRDKSEIVVYLSDEDPKLKEYKKLKIKNYIIGPHKFYAEAMNFVSSFIDAKYYHVTQDDYVYETKDWDKEAIEVLKRECGGIVVFNDGGADFLGTGNTMGEFISSEIVKGLGYIFWKDFRQAGIERYTKSLGLEVGLYYLNEFIIRHLQANMGKSEKDENWEFTYSDGEIENSLYAAGEWEKVIKDEIQRIKLGKFIVDKYRAKNSRDIDDWTAKREDQIVLINLIEKFNIKSFFEIGTYTAFTTQLLASHPNIERWKGIDTNPKDAHENISKCDSKDYNPTEEFDLVFIDGDHKQVKRDTELALKMNPKVIAWHDYVDTGDFPNLVKKDVDLYKPINVEANVAWKKIRD